MKNFILDFPAVEAIQYDGSEETEKEIREFINDTVVPLTDNSGNKALLLQLEPATHVTFMRVGDYIFREPITDRLIVLSKYDFESIATEI